MAETVSDATQRHTPPTSPQRPRGILKNASQTGAATTRLTWDEENIAATELDKDSLMKITEPKTPYVRYNAELDTVDGIEGEIPPFHLDSGAPDSPLSPNGASRSSVRGSPAVASSYFPADVALKNEEPETRPTLARTPSADRASRRASGSDRGSRSSSRSTSFNLPIDDVGRTQFREGGLGLVVPAGEAVEEDDDMDEETAAKRAEFAKARTRHYSNEAEAMKRAKQLMEDEDEDMSGSGDNAEDGNAPPPVPRLPNGSTH